MVLFTSNHVTIIIVDIAHINNNNNNILLLLVSSDMSNARKHDKQDMILL